jgi:hypothetical protein
MDERKWTIGVLFQSGALLGSFNPKNAPKSNTPRRDAKKTRQRLFAGAVRL